MPQYLWNKVTTWTFLNEMISFFRVAKERKGNCFLLSCLLHCFPCLLKWNYSKRNIISMCNYYHSAEESLSLPDALSMLVLLQNTQSHCKAPSDVTCLVTRKQANRALHVYKCWLPTVCNRYTLTQPLSSLLSYLSTSFIHPFISISK